MNSILIFGNSILKSIKNKGELGKDVRDERSRKQLQDENFRLVGAVLLGS